MSVIKLLTLNTHSLIEKNYDYKLEKFILAILTEKPDIIALQEVNQTSHGKSVNINLIDKYFPCMANVRINEDNHVYNAVNRLSELGLNYNWTWLPIKSGYEKYDEGIAIMTLKPIVRTQQILVSRTDSYDNWKTRRIIGINSDVQKDEWFFSVHYGWWNDEKEPFSEQWKKTYRQLKKYKKVWLMGDFNNPAEVRKEGYDEVIRSGWYDTFSCAENKDDGITVSKAIDGWKDKNMPHKMRIDQIWCSEKTEIIKSEVLFNGKKYPVISDHYGVLIEIQD